MRDTSEHLTGFSRSKLSVGTSNLLADDLLFFSGRIVFLSMEGLILFIEIECGFKMNAVAVHLESRDCINCDLAFIETPSL